MKRSYILSMYFMSEISTTPHSGIAIGKYKCLVKKKKKKHNNCHLFLPQKSTKCSSKCEQGFTCNCKASPGWYRQCFGSLKQAGLIPVLFCFFLSKQGWYLNCFASITIFTNIVNLHLQFTCVAVSVDIKTDQEFVLSNRTPWQAHLPHGYRIIQLSCLLKRTL